MTFIHSFVLSVVFFFYQKIELLQLLFNHFLQNASLLTLPGNKYDSNKRCLRLRFVVCAGALNFVVSCSALGLERCESRQR